VCLKEEHELVLNEVKNNGYFTWRPKHIFYHFFLEWEIRQTKVVEKVKTPILCSVTFFSLENRAIDEIMWKKYWRTGQATNDRQYGTKLQIHTLGLCNTHCFSTATMVARTCLIVTLYVRCLSFYVYLKSLHSSENPFSPPDLYYVTDKSPFLVLIAVRGWVDPKTIVRSEGLSQWKFSMAHRESNPRPFGL
jgi:hypothetical protein